ncbi:MAG: asparaginase, partial [Rhodoferax sp.]|nr:asparaginase [Rhodoferax sp.]
MAEIVVFLGMGGTIAGTAQSAGDNVGYTAAQVGVQALLQAVPGLQRVLGAHQALAEQVCQIDSKDLAHADWAALQSRVVHHLAQADVTGVVVTHGTDTLEETAYFLARAVPAELLTHKPVVLTCAMRPASSLTPDGPGNMADAAAVALSAGARGVLVVCAGKVHAAAQVQKIHPYRVDAFDSGEAGPLGLVEEGQLRLLSDFPVADRAQPAVDMARLQATGWPRVELLTSHAGAGGALVRALLLPQQGIAPLRGIVVAGTGNGTIHKELEAALLEAQACGVRVL